MVYWFVSRKQESLLAREFEEALRSYLGLPEAEGSLDIKRILEMAFLLSRQRSFTLVIDEFQNFRYVRPQIFSELQQLWDTYKDEVKLNLIVSGSIPSLMNEIFQSSSEPLFGRATRIIKLRQFDVDTLKQIFFRYSPDATNKDFLLFYIITGGVPKYVEILVDENALVFDAMLDFVFSKHSPLLEEGKSLLIEEFGQDYTVYFSILSLLAQGKNKRAELENLLGRPLAGYLTRLEKYFELIDRQLPVFSSKKRLLRYRLKDNFLRFWFYFVYRNWSAVEIENWQLLKQNFLAHYSVFAGRQLEEYFKEKLALTKKYSLIGSWWDKTGQNEIDIVAVNEQEKKVDLFEVKMNKSKIDIRSLYTKTSHLRDSLKDYTFEYAGLSIEDM